MYFDDKPIENLNEDSLGRASFSKLLAQTLFNLKNSDSEKRCDKRHEPANARQENYHHRKER